MEILKDLLPEQCYEPRTKPVDVIMIHSCSDCLNNPKDPYNVEAIKTLFAHLGVSAHYIIGRTGKIIQLVEENNIAYHAGKGCSPHWPERENTMNHYSIGIELLAIGSERDMSIHMNATEYACINPKDIGYTEAQYKTLNLLINELSTRYGIPKNRKHIMGHDDYAPNRKTDPGELFDWQKIGL